MLCHVCSSIWSFCLGWAVSGFHPSGISFGLSFSALAFFPGALDFPAECQPHQTHASHLHPWSGGHDPPGGPERGGNPQEPADPLSGAPHLCECPLHLLLCTAPLLSLALGNPHRGNPHWTEDLSFYLHLDPSSGGPLHCRGHVAEFLDAPVKDLMS